MVCAICEKEVTVDVHLKIRHRSNIVLRNVTWEIPNDKIENAIIVRRVLEALGCDNRSMLEAASNQHEGDIDVKVALETVNEHAEGSDAELLGDSLYHTGSDEADGLEKIEDITECFDNPQE